MSAWRPEGVADRFGGGKRPAVGDVVAYDRRAWEVRHVADADPTPEEAEKLALYVEPYRDTMRPYRMSLRRVYGERHERENSAGDIALRATVSSYNGLPVYPNGRVPLCSCHGHPWPCLEADQQAEAEKELKRAEKALRLLPGCCPACEEPVTSRQRSITFGGPNVTNPLAEGPTFHLRRKCYSAAAVYEEKWVAAEPGRARSLLTLRCEGTVVVHHDGTAECYGAAFSDCPSVHARHRAYTSCYLQSHGCGRGCTPAGHPGCTPAGRPADPRAITREDAR